MCKYLCAIYYLPSIRITIHFECAGLAVSVQHLQFLRTVTEYLRTATPGWGQLVTHSQKERMGSHLSEGVIALCISVNRQNAASARFELFDVNGYGGMAVTCSGFPHCLACSILLASRCRCNKSR